MSHILRDCCVSSWDRRTKKHDNVGHGGKKEGWAYPTPHVLVSHDLPLGEGVICDLTGYRHTYFSSVLSPVFLGLKDKLPLH